MSLSDPTNQQIATILQSLVEGVQKTGQWMVGQLPDVLHQLVVWTIVKGFAFLGVFIIVSVIGYLVTFKSVDQKNYGGGWSDAKGFSCVIFFIICTILLIVTWANMSNALEAWIAPKLFLLEYASNLLKHSH